MCVPFIGNAVSKLATNWFGDNERALGTTIGALSNPFGCIMGFSLGGLFISEDDKNNHAQGKKHVMDYLWFMAIVVTCMCVPCILLQKERPKVFPSDAAKS